MSKLDLESFGEIVDLFLKENEIQMLLTLPKGTVEVQVEDNVKMGSVVQFYILLNSIKPICAAMQEEMGIDSESPEWEQVVDTLLGMVKAEITDKEGEGG